MATTERKKEREATSVALRECQKETNEASVETGDNEVIVLEDKNQESFTDLEPAAQLHKSDKEISSTTVDSRTQKEMMGNEE